MYVGAFICYNKLPTKLLAQHVEIVLLRGHNWSKESPISKLKHALGSSNRDLSDGVLKLLIASESKCFHFRRKTMDYKYVGEIVKIWLF